MNFFKNKIRNIFLHSLDKGTFVNKITLILLTSSIFNLSVFANEEPSSTKSELQAEFGYSSVHFETGNNIYDFGKKLSIMNLWNFEQSKTLDLVLGGGFNYFSSESKYSSTSNDNEQIEKIELNWLTVQISTGLQNKIAEKIYISGLVNFGIGIMGNYTYNNNLTNVNSKNKITNQKFIGLSIGSFYQFNESFALGTQFTRNYHNFQQKFENSHNEKPCIFTENNLSLTVRYTF